MYLLNMIKLNIRERKEIKFDINVSGVDPRDLRGALRLNIDRVEYGFPISISDGSIVSTIPALEDIIKKDMVDGQEVKAKLEIIANDTYIAPWEDIMLIETPVKIEAKISEVKDIKEESKKPTIKISNVHTNLSKKLNEKKRDDEKEKSEKIKSKFAKSLV